MFTFCLTKYGGVEILVFQVFARDFFQEQVEYRFYSWKKCRTSLTATLNWEFDMFMLASVDQRNLMVIFKGTYHDFFQDQVKKDFMMALSGRFFDSHNKWRV
jgi:hypothetical protein